MSTKSSKGLNSFLFPTLAMPISIHHNDIAEVFYLAGFIKSWGRGIDKVRKGFDAKGLPMPVLESKIGGPACPHPAPC